MKKYIRSSMNDDFDFYSDIYNHKYLVSGDPDRKGYEYMTTDSPVTAIKTWFSMSKKQPYTVSIMTQRRSDALSLLEVATPELLQKLHGQYGCPYKLDYLISAVDDQINKGAKYFHECGFGDQIHPFDIG